jgi:hypothetical protein
MAKLSKIAKATPANPVQAMSHDHAVKWLNARGVVGPFDPDFLDDIVWHICSVALTRAMEETKLFPMNEEGVAAVMEAWSRYDPKDVSTIPTDEPGGILAKRAAQIAQEDLDALSKAA